MIFSTIELIILYNISLYIPLNKLCSLPDSSVSQKPGAAIDDMNALDL